MAPVVDIPNTLSYETVRSNWTAFEQYLVETRYALRAPDGTPTERTYHDVISRVANWITSSRSISKCPDDIYAIISASVPSIIHHLIGRHIVPATPVLMNGGSLSKRPGYFACFPLGYVPDTLEGIMSTADLMADIYARAGGCGINVSKLRPKSSLVDNSQGYASGPISFMQIFDAVTGTISQGGRRRGALMIDCSDSHPDWRDFVWCKASKQHHFENMNISLDIEDELRDEVVNEVAKAAWSCGDPGLIFIRNAYRNTPIPLELEPRQVNPCAEYMSIAKTACNLLSINVPQLMEESSSLAEYFDGVYKSAYYASMMGSMLTWQNEGYAADEIREETQRYRPVGIGMLGLHSAMIRADIAYSSNEALAFARQTQAALALGSMAASAELMLASDKQYRVPCRTEWMQDHVLRCADSYVGSQDVVTGALTNIMESLSQHGGLYNIVTTVQAPTGSISQLVHSASNGVEPLFDVRTQRKVKDITTGWKEFTLFPREMFDEYGTLVRDPEAIARQTTNNIPSKFQLQIMAEIQGLCHTAISKTINCAQETTVDEIKELIRSAYDLGLKSFTVYRDNCKDVQVLTREDTPKIQIPVTTNGHSVVHTNGVHAPLAHTHTPQVSRLPRTRNAVIHELSGPRTCYVTMTNIDDRVREIFINAAKGGTTLNAFTEALGRILSIALRANPELLDEFARTLRGIDSGDIYQDGSLRFKSIPDAIGYLLSPSVDETIDEGAGGDICRECGKMGLVRQGNCRTCRVCGYSTC